MMSNILLGFKAYFNFLSSQIKSDGILPEVKLNDIKIECFLSGKNEKESQVPACKINTLKAGISPSFDLPILLSLLKIQCNSCSKM